MAAKNKPNKLYLTRLYDAPVKTVWEAWTDPVHLAKWWGPRGFTITRLNIWKWKNTRAWFTTMAATTTDPHSFASRLLLPKSTERQRWK